MIKKVTLMQKLQRHFNDAAVKFPDNEAYFRMALEDFKLRSGAKRIEDVEPGSGVGAVVSRAEQKRLQQDTDFQAVMTQARKIEEKHTGPKF